MDIQKVVSEIHSNLAQLSDALEEHIKCNWDDAGGNGQAMLSVIHKQLDRIYESSELLEKELQSTSSIKSIA